jgi:pyruvate/2-oxoacid:ferredoxin oxidoreductase alpha subunit
MESASPALEAVDADFRARFGRGYGAVEAYRCEDAEVAVVATGTTAGTARVAVDSLRARGEKAGLLRIRLFRPFPAKQVHEALRGARKAAVLDRNCSFGAGGIFAQETRAALCNPGGPPVYSYVAGLGGRDVTPGLIEGMYFDAKRADAPAPESVWLGLSEEPPK